MNKLKLSIVKKINDNPKYKPVFEGLNGNIAECHFVNFGADPNGSGNIYGVYFPHPIDSTKIIEAKGSTSENNNSLKIFFAKESNLELLPTHQDKFIKESLEIEIAQAFDRSRPFPNFFQLLDRLDSLSITQAITKAEKDKEVMLWEKYIKAVKAIFKNQEEVF